MNPRQSGRGRPEPDLDPHKGPLVALAWALFVLRPPRGHSGHKTLEEIAQAIRYHKSMISKLTSGKSLPSLGPMTAYLKFYGVENTEPWERLRGLAQEAVIEADKLQEFAEAFMDLCAKSLPEQYTQRIGTTQDLVASWSGHEASEDESLQAQDDHFAPMPPTEDVAGQDGGTPGPLGASPAGPGGRASNARRLTWMVTMVAVLALVVAVTVPKPWEDDSGGITPLNSMLATCTPVTTQLRIASSTEKAKILNEIAQAYRPRSSQGQCVKVVVTGIDSGSAMRALARGWNAETDGGPPPDVWAPASRAWLFIARRRATQNKNKEALDRLPNDLGTSIASSPLTIAMPETAVQRLGWQGKKITWKDLVELATRPDFKLGKTNPEISTSGMNALVATVYALTGTTDELTVEALNKVGQSGVTVRQEMADLEKAVVHYGDTTLTSFRNMRHADDADSENPYISAVTAEESSVITYNKGYPCGSQSDEPGCEKKAPPKTKLVAFYPANNDNVGTIYSDHPYIPLNELSPAQKQVAVDFQNVLITSKLAQDSFAEAGFRTPSHEFPANIPQADGVSRAPLPALLEVPSTDVLDSFLKAWRGLRKPANVLVLIDTSESMRRNANEDEVETSGGPSKLDLVKQASDLLLKGFTDRDRVGLGSFSSKCTLPGSGTDNAPNLSALGRQTDSGTHRYRLKEAIGNLSTGSNTALYNCVNDAVQYMRDKYDENAINAVVVLSDGQNSLDGDGPSISLKDLLKTLPSPDKPVGVFPIAYGNKAEKKTLWEIAKATNARAYDASNPNSIANVLINVISNF